LLKDGACLECQLQLEESSKFWFGSYFSKKGEK
jgi:hypothetical protein